MTTREKRDSSGQIVREQVEIEIKRKINTIQGGARFGHYLVDLVVLIGIMLVLTFLGVIEPARTVTYGNGGVSFRYFFDLTSLMLTFGYYLISELTMGRTIGKFVTNSYVIDEYAKKPEFSVLLIRTLCRLIPFEGFSCLGERGWHDTLSKTYVVSKTEWETLKKELQRDGVSSSDEILD